MDEQKEQVALVALAGVAVVAGAVWYAVVSRQERAKRKKIQEWKQMNLSATAAFKRRMMDLLDDPNATSSDFWKAWREEQKFMKLIHDQPMY